MLRCHEGQEEFSLRAFLSRRAMSTPAIRKKGGNKPVDRPSQSEKRIMKNTSWKEIARPVPCYLVMCVSAAFQGILAVLLLPYTLLNH